MICIEWYLRKRRLHGASLDWYRGKTVDSLTPPNVIVPHTQTPPHIFSDFKKPDPSSSLFHVFFLFFLRPSGFFLFVGRADLHGPSSWSSVSERAIGQSSSSSVVFSVVHGVCRSGKSRCVRDDAGWLARTAKPRRKKKASVEKKKSAAAEELSKHTRINFWESRAEHKIAVLSFPQRPLKHD